MGRPICAPGRVGDRRSAEWWARYERAAVSPGMARRLLQLGMQVAIRDVLPVPTLVLHRRQDEVVSAALGRAFAALVTGNVLPLGFGSRFFGKSRQGLDSVRLEEPTWQ